MPLITPPYDAFPFQNIVQPAGAGPGSGAPDARPDGLVIGGKYRNTLSYLLTSAQLLALQTTAVQLVGAPGLPPKGFGSSLMLSPRAMWLQYLFKTTAYTIGNADNAFQIEYTGKTTNLMKTNATGLVDQVVSEVVQDVQPAVAGVVLAQTNCANLGLEVKLVGTTPALTLGDGTVVLTLDYDALVLQ